uniref:Uncharacterized protein n=1 Tax=Arundo donax TaxID=35708 RepID=A0A0A9GXU7_ARUDO
MCMWGLQWSICTLNVDAWRLLFQSSMRCLSRTYPPGMR